MSNKESNKPTIHMVKVEGGNAGDPSALLEALKNILPEGLIDHLNQKIEAGKKEADETKEKLVAAGWSDTQMHELAVWITLLKNVPDKDFINAATHMALKHRSVESVNFMVAFCHLMEFAGKFVAKAENDSGISVFDEPMNWGALKENSDRAEKLKELLTHAIASGQDPADDNFEDQFPKEEASPGDIPDSCGD